jgi:hypothetical protein
VPSNVWITCFNNRPKLTIANLKIDTYPLITEKILAYFKSNNISQLKFGILVEKINYRWCLRIKFSFGIRKLQQTILGGKKKNLFARGSYNSLYRYKP